MKCFSWTTDGLKTGISVQTDEKFGQVVVLGTKNFASAKFFRTVGLDRYRPAIVEGERIMEATPKKIVLKAKDKKPEKVFYVLEQSMCTSMDALVRINTANGYKRGFRGQWRTIAGHPEDLMVGYGTDSGGLGGWNEGLVVLHPGDVLQVQPSRTWGEGNFVLWMSEDGQLQTEPEKEYELKKALAKSDAQEFTFLTGQMPCFTYSRGEITSGIEVEKGSSGGPIVSLGEAGRGRTLTEVPVIGAEVEFLEEAAVAQLSEKIVGLVVDNQPEEPGACLLMAHFGDPGRSSIWFEQLSGEPKQIAWGQFASGDAGRAGHSTESVWILRPGDAIVVMNREVPYTVVENEDGRLATSRFLHWEIKEAKSRPADFSASGKVLFGQAVPSEWLGRIVEILGFAEDDDKRLEVKCTGELLSLSPVVLDIGWDGRDQTKATVSSGVWVRLTNLKPNRLGAEEMSQRKLLISEATGLLEEAKTATQKSLFPFLREEMKQKINSFAQRVEGFGLETSETITAWCQAAKEMLQEFSVAEPEAAELERRQNSGEILVDFEAWHRRGGAKNHGDGWVVRPDGSLRERDSDRVPMYKSDGYYHWDLVAKDELALHWEGGLDVEVPHLPINGLSEAQLNKVAEIEEELGLLPGSFGLNPEATTEMDKKVSEIRAEYNKLPPDLQCPEGWGNKGYWDFPSIAGGVSIREDDGTQKFVSRKRIAPPIQYASREAYIIFQRPCAGGMLEFVAYHKFGQWQLSMYWREFNEGEEPSIEPQAPKLEAEQRLPSDEEISLLRQKFGKK